MKKWIKLGVGGGSAILMGLLSSEAQAISNGGFESGFSAWTIANQLGSDGTFHLQTGTVSPVNGEVVPAPPGGTTAAMTDSQGPGAHVLFQTFTVSSPVPSTTVEFDLFIGNRADAFYLPAPNTLDFATPALNQQARVDILSAGADPFSVNPADILLNVFQANPGDPLVSGYTHHSLDITALLNGNLGAPLMLRFAESDNVNFFQLGVDNVAIATVTSTVPDSSSRAMEILVLLGLCLAGRTNIRRQTTTN